MAFYGLKFQSVYRVPGWKSDGSLFIHPAPYGHFISVFSDMKVKFYFIHLFSSFQSSLDSSSLNPFLVFVLSSFFVKDVFILVLVGLWIRTEGGASDPWCSYFMRTWLLPPSIFLALKTASTCLHLWPQNFFPGTVCDWHLCCLLDVEQTKVYLDKLHCPRPRHSFPFSLLVHSLPGSFSLRASSTPWSKVVCNDLSVSSSLPSDSSRHVLQTIFLYFPNCMTDVPFSGLLSSVSQLLKREKGANFSMWSGSPAMDKIKTMYLRLCKS